jgi:glucokinase
VFDPEALILGGGLVNLGDYYLAPALDTARKGAFAQVIEDALITTAKLGNRAGALGAAALVISARAP